MGCYNSKAEKISCDIYMLRDMQKIHAFLMGRENIDDLWIQFDSNYDSMVDMNEFRELLYHSIIYFLRMRNPLETSMPTPESYREKIDKLSLRFNANNDERISKNEFKQFGDYLHDEKALLQSKLR